MPKNRSFNRVSSCFTQNWVKFGFWVFFLISSITSAQIYTIDDNVIHIVGGAEVYSAGNNITSTTENLQEKSQNLIIVGNATIYDPNNSITIKTIEINSVTKLKDGTPHKEIALTKKEKIEKIIHHKINSFLYSKDAKENTINLRNEATSLLYSSPNNIQLKAIITQKFFFERIKIKQENTPALYSIKLYSYDSLNSYYTVRPPPFTTKSKI